MGGRLALAASLLQRDQALSCPYLNITVAARAVTLCCRWYFIYERPRDPWPFRSWTPALQDYQTNLCFITAVVVDPLKHWNLTCSLTLSLFLFLFFLFSPSLCFPHAHIKYVQTHTHTYTSSSECIIHNYNSSAPLCVSWRYRYQNSFLNSIKHHHEGDL